MKLKYVGPFDAVEIDRVGVVKRHQQIEVPDELGGRPPVARVAVAHVELVAAIAAVDHELAKALREEIIGLDHGIGLLAQPANWEAVQAPKKGDPE